MGDTLKPYMGYSDCGGPEEGALLIFARTYREARRIGIPAVMGWGADFVDVRVRRLRDGDGAHLREKEEPHVLDWLPNATCRDCEKWTLIPLDRNGRCETCADDAEADHG